MGPQETKMGPVEFETGPFRNSIRDLGGLIGRYEAWMGP